MRNIVLTFIIIFGLTSCRPTATLPIMSPTLTSTISHTATITATNEPTSTLTPIPTPSPIQDLSVTKDEIVNFMVDYIVKNEIEAMIDIINNEDIPLIKKPPAQFIIIFSPISQAIDDDYSKLMNALDTNNAERVWIYKDGELLAQTDTQIAIRDYQEFIRNAPENPSIFMWGYNEFGIVSISDDGQKTKVYLAASCGSACGHGILLGLEKNEDNQWELKDITPIWGS